MDNRIRVQDNTGRSVQNVMRTKSAEMGANIASQGTTRVIFDSATVGAAANQVLRFFALNNAFPNTNMNQQFEAGEGMIITHLAFFRRSGGVGSFEMIGLNDGVDNNTYFTVKIGNSQVIQPTCLPFFSSYVSFSETNADYGAWLPLESGLFIPPQIDFEIALYLDNAQADDTYHVFAAGLGSLLNIKNY